MAKLVTALGVWMIFIGVWIAVDPGFLLSMEQLDTRRGQLLAAGARFVTGIVLVAAAPATRYPKGLRIFGGVVLIAGVVILLLPLAAWTHLIHWGLQEQLAIARVAGSVGGIVLGAFLVFASRLAPREVRPE